MTEIIVALDHKNLDDALALVHSLGDAIKWYKVGSVLFTKEGGQAVKRLKELNKKVFLDLKFHDIPNTVAGAVENSVELGADMFTLHASGGAKMIARAHQRAQSVAKKRGLTAPKSVAVTLLTSLSSQDIAEDFGIKKTPEDIVKKLVSVVIKAGANGIVASPNELPMIRANFDKNLIVITPGVRPVWAKKGDQQRVMTPKDAARAGADFLVIGRPIIAAHNPKAAAELILQELKEA